jgi:hypothetical protein
MRTTISIAIAVLLAGTGPAAADRPRRQRADLSVGMAFLHHEVEAHTGNFDGFALGGGVRRGRFAVLASYQGYVDTTEQDPGSLRRAGLALRYDRSDLYLHSQRASIVVGPFFELGAGYEWLRWNEDRRADRPDLSFGVGGSVRMGRRQHEVGVELGVRFLVARAVAPMDGLDLGGGFFFGIPFSP